MTTNVFDTAKRDSDAFFQGLIAAIQPKPNKPRLYVDFVDPDETQAATRHFAQRLNSSILQRILDPENVAMPFDPKNTVAIMVILDVSNVNPMERLSQLRKLQFTRIVTLVITEEFTSAPSFKPPGFLDNEIFIPFFSVKEPMLRDANRTSLAMLELVTQL
jgi:hypothetical protein